MVTRLVLLKLPPVYVPPMTRLADAPGVELLKLTVVLTEAPGARLPRLCGNGVPLVAPSLAVVNITLLAVAEPRFWIETAAATLVPLVRLSVEVTTRLTPPQGTVQVYVVSATTMLSMRMPGVGPPAITVSSEPARHF